MSLINNGKYFAMNATSSLQVETPFDASALRWSFAEKRSVLKLRHKDAAIALGISEAQAIEAHLGLGSNLQNSTTGVMRSVRLKADFPALLESLHSAGPLMALTRNQHIVHERTGTYINGSHSGHMGLMLGEDIDLRLFYRQWKYGYLVEEPTDSSPMQSLQFFDHQGDAVHKIFIRAATHLAEFNRIARSFYSTDQTARLLELTVPSQNIVVDERNVNIATFHNDWREMRDTHEFFGVLKRHNLSRHQALRLAEPQFASEISNTATRQLLEMSSVSFTPIMVFVSNKGCIQIHSGPVNAIKVIGPWLNVLDENFNLHIREDQIASTWVVRKPTADGIVTSLEIYDSQQETMAYFFGVRKPGIPESKTWRNVIGKLA
jgi:putative hemin transport protein